MEYIILWLICGVAAALVGSSRGDTGVGWFLIGVVLGPFGLLLAFTAGVKCHYCQSKISEKATVCPKCQREVPTARLRVASQARRRIEEEGRVEDKVIVFVLIGLAVLWFVW